MSKDCGSCHDCSCDESPPADPQRHYGNPQQRDESSFLDSPRRTGGPKPDATPLEARCPHYDSGVAVRSQCNICIISWVLAVGRDMAEKAAQSFDQARRLVAARRIREAIASYLQP